MSPRNNRNPRGVKGSKSGTSWEMSPLARRTSAAISAATDFKANAIKSAVMTVRERAELRAHPMKILTGIGMPSCVS